MRGNNVHADWLVILRYVVLIVMGWFTLCGASHHMGYVDVLSWDTRTGKQLVLIGLSFVLGMVILMTDDKYLDTFSGFFYWLMMLVLLITPFIAKDIKGSKSWISLGFMNLQPAEFAKCATALFVARYIHQNNYRLDNFRQLIRTASLVLLPLALIVLQKETGSALVYFAFFLMFYREGMTGSILFCALAAVVYFVVGVKFSASPLPGTLTPVGEFCVLLIIQLCSIGMLQVYEPRKTPLGRLLTGSLLITSLAWAVSHWGYNFDISWVQLLLILVLVGYMLLQNLSERKRLNHYALISLFALGSVGFLYSADYTLNNILQPHQQGRVRVLLGMEEDLRGAGYNVNQAKIAIGSGGLSGKGFMNGTQTKLDYVPEQATDFIFCTVGEEEGFIGCTAVLLTYLGLILRLMYLAERQDSVFGRVYGYSVLSIFLFHLFINVGMVIGLTPVIGIPLPFFSYGGSSLWGFTLLLFIFLRIDKGYRARKH
ncbi:MAG: rod shape-determining protein RodA [Bacteroidaceae bacterium]|nr:rod shape-determining protein RodA [Bacteroidaceae bacterium]